MVINTRFLRDVRLGKYQEEGSDAPPLGERVLVLGGIEVDHRYGLAGHSDGDVALYREAVRRGLRYYVHFLNGPTDHAIRLMLVWTI